MTTIDDYEDGETVTLCFDREAGPHLAVAKLDDGTIVVPHWEDQAMVVPNVAYECTLHQEEDGWFARILHPAVVLGEPTDPLSTTQVYADGPRNERLRARRRDLLSQISFILEEVRKLDQELEWMEEETHVPPMVRR